MYRDIYMWTCIQVYSVKGVNLSKHYNIYNLDVADMIFNILLRLAKLFYNFYQYQNFMVYEKST